MTIDLRARKSPGSGWLANLCAQFLPFFAFFLAAPFLLSVMGQAEFGLLMIFSLAPQIAGQLDFGLATAGTRLIASFDCEQKPGHARRVFFEATAGLGALGCVYGVLLLLLTAPLDERLHLTSALGSGDLAKGAVVATAVWVWIGILAVSASLPFRAFQFYRVLAYVQAGCGVLFWGGAVVLAFNDFGVVSMLQWGGATALINAGLLFALLRKWAFERSMMPSDWLLPKVWRYSAGTFASQASSLLTYHLDKLLVGALVSPAAAGIYTACSNMAAKLLAVIAAISTFSFPRATVLHTSGDRNAIRQLFVRGTRLNILLGLSFGIPAIALSRPFVQLWLGSEAAAEFSSGFSLLVMGYLLAATSVVAANVASGMGDSRTPALFSVIGGVITLVLCAFLAYRFGSLGAAIGSMLGMSQALIFCSVIGKRLGGACLGTLAKGLWPSLLVSLVVGGLLYSFAYLVVGWLPLIAFSGVGALAIFGTGMIGYNLGDFGEGASKNDSD